MKNEEIHIGVVLPKQSVTIITKNVVESPILSWTEPRPPANKYSEIFNVEIGNLSHKRMLPVPPAHQILLVHVSSPVLLPQLLFPRFHPSLPPIGGQINVTE